jgi:hypothetical protein
METLKNLLDKLYGESETRNKENEAISDYESISYEVGVQSTIKDIRNWLEEHSFSQKVNDLEAITLVRVD